MARTASRRRGRSGGLTDRLPLKLGGIFGAVAYVVGLILSFLLVTLDGEIEPDDQQVGSSLDVAGWVFYNAHFVDTEASASAGGFSESSSESIISESAGLPEVIYYLVPILLLAGAAYLLLQQEYVTEATDAALSGASVVIGYLPLALIGTFLFEASESEGGASVSVGPETGAAIIFAGLLFPLVLGAIGGFAAFKTQDNRRGRY